MKILRRLLSSFNAAREAPLREVDAATVRGWQQSGTCVLIDVREDAEYRALRVPGARLAPLSRLEQAMPSVPAGMKVVFLCQRGARTRMQAARLASCCAEEAFVLKGGIVAWQACGFPVERS